MPLNKRNQTKPNLQLYRIEYGHFLNTSIWPIKRNPNVLQLRVRVDMGVMAIMGYRESLELEPHSQMQLSVIPRILPFLEAVAYLSVMRKVRIF